MSLVAYDASSDEEDAGEPPAAAAAAAPAPASPIPTGPQPRPSSPSTSTGAAPQAPAPPPPGPSQNVAPTNSSSVSVSTPSLDLPDVAELFASPSLPSRDSASVVSNSSRKRESNGSAIQDPRSKFPRSQSAQSRGARNAAANTLVPPQLSGRSNIVTEDMGKLFVARRKD